MQTWFERALLTVLVPAGIAAGVLEAPGQPDPLAVKRDNPVYREVFTDRKVDREVGLWYHGLSLSHLPEAVRALYSKDQWAAEQENYLRETGAAGMDGPFMPWALYNFGAETVERLHRMYGMKFPLMLHSGAHSAKAKERGAVYTCENIVASWDPRYMDAAAEFAESWLKEYGSSPWLAEVIGRDEPLNYAESIRNPEVVADVNADLKRVYGVKLALLPGDPSLPWYEWPTDPALEKASPRDVALLRIAMWRWLNARLHEAAAREHEIVRRLAPGKLHFAYNRNAINIRDVIDKPVRHSIDFLDQALMEDVTDGFSADPYPTASLNRDGRARALYHVGFVSKLVTDLAAGKPVKMILQAFAYAGRTPTPDNLKEWASQAAKTGAVRIEWYTYGNTRFAWPELHSELLRLSRLWKDLPALAIPDTAEVAVIFGDDARAAANDAPLHGYYSLHVLLGERLGAWYAFIGENHVRRGLQSLDRARLLIAPQLGYVSREFAEKLAARVEEGATLLVLDPDAFSWDFETGSLERMRERLIGPPPGGKRDADALVPTDEARNRFGGIGKLPLGPGAAGVNARNARVPKGATVLFTYGDGAPAAWSRPFGKGEVIAFAAMPFGNSEAAFAQGGWETFFGAQLDRLGIGRGLPLWRFEFPKTGGEVETFKPVVDMEYNRLKGKESE